MTNAKDNPVRERKVTMAEDSTEHLGSSDCSSGQYQCTTHYLACECRERRLAEEQRFLEAAYQNAVKERDKYKSAVERLRVLLLEVLENDEVLEGFNADNLEPEFRQRIRDGLSWRIE
jgi:hypothetical protein